MLATTYRPTNWAEFAGNDKAVEAIRAVLARRSFGETSAECFLIDGPSGTGKTTLAAIVAGSIPGAEITELDGDKCTVAAVQELADKLNANSSPLFAHLSHHWTAVIVNECHAMTRGAVQGWLTLLERKTPRVVVIFTTTQTELPFGDFAAPFASRCRKYRLAGCEAAVGAKRLLAIAQAEGIDLDTRQAVAIMAQAQGNLREGIAILDSGVLPAPGVSMPAIPPAVKTRGKAPAACSAFDAFMSS